MTESGSTEPFPANELAWVQRPRTKLLQLSWPIALSMLSYSLMTVVDTIIVGRLGSGELAGVATSGTTAFALLFFPLGIVRGVKTLVSQAAGAGRSAQVGAYLGAALICALGLGIVTAAVGQPIAEALRGIATTEVSRDSAATYLKIRSLGAPLLLLYVAVRDTRYGQGDARTPMVATLLANAVNGGLAVLFVFGFGWGVAGAAWATVVAQLVELGFMVWRQNRLGWGIRAVRFEHVRALWRIGLPTAIQVTLEIGAFQLLTWLIVPMGDVQIAAHQIAIQVFYLVVLPTFAIGESASILAGQAVGAKREALVNVVARQSLVVMLAYAAVCALVLGAGRRLIAAGFSSDPELIDTTAQLLAIAVLFIIFDVLGGLARAILRGTGDVRYAAVVGVVTSWVCTPPLAWLLGWHAGLGALGGWLGLCLETVTAAALLWWRLARGGWLNASRELRASTTLEVAT